jgi:Zn-dependent protease with chaperone function
MVESLFYILAMALALAYPTGHEPLFFLEPGRRATSVLGMEVPTSLLFAALVVLFYGLWSAAAFSLGLQEPGSDSVRRLGRRRLFNRILALVLLAVLVYVFHLPLELKVESSQTLTAALVLLPFFAMSAFSTLFSSLREAILKGHESLRPQLFFTFKSFLGFAMVPMFLMLAVIDLISLVPSLEQFIAVHPTMVQLVMFGMMGVFASVIPFLLRFVFGAYPLPDDDFRRSLEELASKAEFSCADLLVLPTSGTRIGNAFIVGLFGPARYVFFTDYLLANLPPEEVRCVLAHEIGHAKRHHLPAFFYLSVTSIVFAAVFFSYLDQQKSPLAVLVFPAFTLLWFVLLGFISRRFESEADLYGAKLCGNPVLFGEALYRVALINGMPPDVGGYRHFSIKSRVETVLQAHRQPLYGQVAELIAVTMRRFCLWFFVSAVSILAMGVYGEFHNEGPLLRRYQGKKLVEKSRATLFDQWDYESAERDLNHSVELNPADARARLYLAYAYLASRRFDDAARQLKVAEEQGLMDPLDRLLARNIERTLPPAR